MSAVRRTSKRGFTLVEILIVVIILGILAAIVIPQFTSASTDARNNSLKSLLQTMRSQVELYKLQHNDQLPGVDDDGDIDAADFWADLTGRTNPDGTTGGNLGPYLQSTPVNPLTQRSGLFVASTELEPGDASGAADTDGFLITPLGKIFGIAADGKVFAE
jgi:general secretion pathway protein G